MSNSSPMSPMSVGNVVSAGFRLYSSHLKPYLSISTKATLWAMLPWATLMLLLTIVFVPVAASKGQNLFSLVLLLLIFPWVGLAIYSSAKSSTNSALIARLAYGELIGKPEDTKTAFRLIKPRMWSFLLVHIAVGCVMFGVNFGLSIVQNILILIPAIALRNNSIAIGVLTILIQIAGLGVYSWFWAHFLIPEVAIAMEENTNAFDMVGRSWKLSQGSANRILTVLFVALMITIPLYGLAAIPIMPPLTQLITAASRANLDGGVSVIGWSLFVVTIGLFLILLVNLFTLPFWQALKAVIYYDLRARREGVDLKFRNSINDQPSN